MEILMLHLITTDNTSGSFCLYCSGFTPEQTNTLLDTHTNTLGQPCGAGNRRAAGNFPGMTKPVKLPPHILLSWLQLCKYCISGILVTDIEIHTLANIPNDKKNVWTNWDINLSCVEKTKNLNSSPLLRKVDRQIGGEVWFIKVRCQSKRECVSWGLGGRKETHSWCVVEKQHITSSR